MAKYLSQAFLSRLQPNLIGKCYVSGEQTLQTPQDIIRYSGHTTHVARALRQFSNFGIDTSWS